ncbi:MAG TPA: hypothetical protein VF929_03170 [Gemmatimonadaceae bacterium]
MRHTLRLSAGTVLLAISAACSRSAEQPQLSDDLKRDLARVGGGDVQLAGSSANRVDVVSASERTQSPTPSPKAPTVSRAPSVRHGSQAIAPSVHHQSPAPAQATERAADVAPAEVPSVDRAPEAVPAQGRPRAPMPSTQREPPGGWRTPGQVIRNAPFPINP